MNTIQKSCLAACLAITACAGTMNAADDKPAGTFYGTTPSFPFFNLPSSHRPTVMTYIVRHNGEGSCHSVAHPENPALIPLKDIYKEAEYLFDARGQKSLKCVSVYPEIIQGTMRNRLLELLHEKLVSAETLFDNITADLKKNNPKAYKDLEQNRRRAQTTSPQRAEVAADTSRKTRVANGIKLQKQALENARKKRNKQNRPMPNPTPSPVKRGRAALALVALGAPTDPQENSGRPTRKAKSKAQRNLPGLCKQARK